MLEIVTEFAIKIVIEIGMEQTRLFQCTLFHYAEKSDRNDHFDNILADREFSAGYY